MPAICCVVPAVRSGLLLLVAAIVFLSAAAPFARAQDGAAVVLEGQRFANRLKVADVDLRLNGTGLRAVGWFKAFAVALYLREPAATAAQVLAQAGPKRLQLRMLRTLPTSELAKAVHKGVLRNSTEQEAASLADQLAAFEERINAVSQVRKGDVVDLDLEPGGALRFSVNGTLRGEWADASTLYAAVLRAFVGSSPFDAQLKSGLLGQR